MRVGVRRVSAPRRRGFVGLRVVAAGVAGVVMGDWVAGMLAAPMLDLDPLAVALPAAGVAWAVTVNLVAMAALPAVAGRMADLAGRRGVLAVGLALYVLGASAVIVAPSWPVLVGARLGQGAGIALMVPAALAMLLAALPERRRPGGVALWIAACAAGVLGMQAGGGWLLATFGWRGLFLPGAVLAAALLLFAPALPRSLGAPGHASAPRALAGAVLLVTGIAAAVLTLARGGVWGWTSVLTLGCASAATLLLLTATLTLRHTPDPEATDSATTRTGLGRTPANPRSDLGWTADSSEARAGLGRATDSPDTHAMLTQATGQAGRGRAAAPADPQSDFNWTADSAEARADLGRAANSPDTQAGLGWAAGVSGAFGGVFFALLATGPAYVAGVPVLDGSSGAGPGWLWLVPVLVGMAAAAPFAARVGRRHGMNGVALGGAVALASGCGSLLAGPYPLLVLAGALLAGAGLGALATGALTTGTAAAGRGNLSAGVGAVETARVVGASAGLAGAAVLTTSGVPGITGAGPDAVLLACVAVAVLTAAAASWRMVTARRHRAVQASLRAARQEAESLRGLLLELRATFTEVRGQADRELVRLGLQDVPAPWGNPHGQE
ncbi:MFS transporter [Nonomuraea ferruginea]|uniref:MFS transporter n=1 Tax=Nonomuraea ferruginea TaxID=46174 RepID=A0ABT4SUC0_9ACTN|nr:MFS transporter [Nonomuraea ferruginea]MDA0640862.1 MFS transporter [Nonomuraea ferruginea]